MLKICIVFLNGRVAEVSCGASLQARVQSEPPRNAAASTTCVSRYLVGGQPPLNYSRVFGAICRLFLSSEVPPKNASILQIGLRGAYNQWRTSHQNMNILQTADYFANMLAPCV